MHNITDISFSTVIISTVSETQTSTKKTTYYRYVLIVVVIVLFVCLGLVTYCIIGLNSLKDKFLRLNDQPTLQLSRGLENTYQALLVQLYGNKNLPTNLGRNEGLKPVQVVSDLHDHNGRLKKNDDGSEKTSVPWQNSECNFYCPRKDFERKPLVVISLDGFACDYLEKRIVKTLNYVAACGTSAKYMFSSYPSKTFPNHFTMATGLYPESHGIIDNYVHDAQISPELVYVVRNPDNRYYRGEPIWVAAEKSGLRTACLFWFGCAQNISGIAPTYNIKYNRSLSYKARVDQIADWLLLDVSERPSLIMVYFDEPDTIGHFHQSSSAVDKVLLKVDSTLNYFFSTLHSKNILDCINVVIVSDHGMQDLSTRVYLNEYFNTAGMLISTGVFSRVELANSLTTSNELVEKLKCKNNGTLFRIYDKEHMPRRLHYTKSERIGDLLIQGQPGTTFHEKRGSDSSVIADHGYDYVEKTMRAIFFARGPSITSNLLLEPFQNIELFNLFLDLLEIKSTVANNGTSGRLRKVLRKKMEINKPISLGIKECDTFGSGMRPFVTSCSNDCEKAAEDMNNSLNACLSDTLSDFISSSNSSVYCYVHLCSVTIGTSLHKTDFTAFAYESISESSFKNFSAYTFNKLKCGLRYGHIVKGCWEWQSNYAKQNGQEMELCGLLADPDSRYNYLDITQVLLHKNFIKGAFMDLQKLTRLYAMKYRRLIVITGTLFDYTNNGVVANNARDLGTNVLYAERNYPSHLFRIIIRCKDNYWSSDGHRCRDPQQTIVLSFILPNVVTTHNCLKPFEYLFDNTARVRDIELLTGLVFFADHDSDIALQVRTFIPENLWEL